MSDLIAITSRGYFTREEVTSVSSSYCIDLPDVISSKDVSPDVKLLEDLSPKLSIKDQD